jgi:hypothetical protein
MGFVTVILFFLKTYQARVSLIAALFSVGFAAKINPAASNVSADATVGSSMMATSAITLAQMIVVRFIFPPGLTDCGQSAPASARDL